VFRFPDGFINSIANCEGFDQAYFIEAHNNAPVQSVRFSPFRQNETNFTGERVPWCESGLILEKRPEYIFDPLLHSGVYYVQEASSMFLDFILKQLSFSNEEPVCLDLCAAPGGKSTIISSHLKNKGLLVSNEVIRSRAKILEENLIKWNSFNSVITNNDPSRFGELIDLFDLIVIDAPCSGSGLFRKDKESVNEWSLKNVELCASRQKRIIADIIPSLKTNGFIIYCTCSYSYEENEEVIDWALNNFSLESVPIKIPAEWGVVETKSRKNKANGYRFYPDKLSGEGFFISVLSNLNSENKRINLSNYSNKKTSKNYFSEWINKTENATTIEANNELHIIPNYHKNLIDYLKQRLNILNFGVRAGKMIREELIPEHSLAMSSFLSDKVNKIEIDLPLAISYLRKEPILLPNDKQGWSVLTYKGNNLGWVKILKGRVNNYYPKEWRILKTFDGEK
jgi:16S rRNA C967 or C1407 C5-methylase (RsmB/RsmF family)/NOL1/NOP2/fmu family ribosome biogenesis protein